MSGTMALATSSLPHRLRFDDVTRDSITHMFWEYFADVWFHDTLTEIRIIFLRVWTYFFLTVTVLPLRDICLQLKHYILYSDSPVNTSIALCLTPQKIGVSLQNCKGKF